MTGDELAKALHTMAAEGPLELDIRGESMTPVLSSGTRVRVAPSRVYLPGDLIAFPRSTDGRLLVHRMIGWSLSRGRLELVARGDARAGADPPVVTRDVLGRVTHAAGDAVRVPLAARVRSLARYAHYLAVRALAR